MSRKATKLNDHNKRKLDEFSSAPTTRKSSRLSSSTPEVYVDSPSAPATTTKSNRVVHGQHDIMEALAIHLCKIGQGTEVGKLCECDDDEYLPQPSASRSTPLVSPPTRVKYGKAGINYRGDALRLRIAPVGEIHLQITCTVHCSGPLPSKDQLTEDFRTSFAKIVNQILETQVKRGWSNEEVKDNMGETLRTSLNATAISSTDESLRQTFYFPITPLPTLSTKPENPSTINLYMDGVKTLKLDDFKAPDVPRTIDDINSLWEGRKPKDVESIVIRCKEDQKYLNLVFAVYKAYLNAESQSSRISIVIRLYQALQPFLTASSEYRSMNRYGSNRTTIQIGRTGDKGYIFKVINRRRVETKEEFDEYMEVVGGMFYNGDSWDDIENYLARVRPEKSAGGRAKLEPFELLNSNKLTAAQIILWWKIRSATPGPEPDDEFGARERADLKEVWEIFDELVKLIEEKREGDKIFDIIRCQYTGRVLVETETLLKGQALLDAIVHGICVVSIDHRYQTSFDLTVNALNRGPMPCEGKFCLRMNTRSNFVITSRDYNDLKFRYTTGIVVFLLALLYLSKRKEDFNGHVVENEVFIRRCIQLQQLITLVYQHHSHACPCVQRRVMSFSQYFYALEVNEKIEDLLGVKFPMALATDAVKITLEKEFKEEIKDVRSRLVKLDEKRTESLEFGTPFVRGNVLSSRSVRPGGALAKEVDEVDDQLIQDLKTQVVAPFSKYAAKFGYCFARTKDHHLIPLSMVTHPVSSTESAIDTLRALQKLALFFVTIGDPVSIAAIYFHGLLTVLHAVRSVDAQSVDDAQSANRHQWSPGMKLTLLTMFDTLCPGLPMEVPCSSKGSLAPAVARSDHRSYNGSHLTGFEDPHRPSVKTWDSSRGNWRLSTQAANSVDGFGGDKDCVDAKRKSTYEMSREYFENGLGVNSNFLVELGEAGSERIEGVRTDLEQFTKDLAKKSEITWTVGGKQR